MSIEKVKTFLYSDKRAFMMAFNNQEDAVNKYLLGICNALASNLDLLNCAPESIRDAAITSAVLGVPIDARQYAYLVPYNNKVQFQLSYKGYIYIAKRDTDVDNISSVIVYSQDEFSFDLGANTINHIPNLDSPSYGSSEDIKFVYAVVRFKQDTGRSLIFEVMTKRQIDTIKDAAKQKYIWNGHYGEMARKTVIKRLCKHAQLGDVALFDQIDSAIERNQIINVTPSGELKVNDDEFNIKEEMLKAINECNTQSDIIAYNTKYRDKIEELALYNVGYSKELGRAYNKKQNEIYVSNVQECLEGCETEESLDKVYAAHEKQINALKVAERNAILNIYSECKQGFIDNMAV